RGQRDLKRGFGGIVDIEFLVQLFQIKYGRTFATLRTTNTWSALDALRDVGLLSEMEHNTLKDGYYLLRLVESRLRIVHNLPVDELPHDPDSLDKLARRLGYESIAHVRASDKLWSDLGRHTTRIRELFLAILDRERRP